MNTSLSLASPHHDSDSSQPFDQSAVVRGIRRVSSKTLLGTLREIEIEHGTQMYRLRITSAGKLILTK